MKVIFLGVGEATDESFPNNSHVILSKTNLLLDCGYSVTRELWKYNPNPNFIDAIYISHPHADHYFGLPPYLIRLHQDGRKKPLAIICFKELKEQILGLLEQGYKGTVSKYQYELKFIIAEEGKKIKFNEFEMEFAPTIHPVKNLAIKIKNLDKTVCYSGDGMFVSSTEKLYKNADLVIHECFTLDEKIDGHAIAADLLPMSQRNGIKCLALTHIRRDVRKNQMKQIKEFAFKQKNKVIIPEPLQEYPL